MYVELVPSSPEDPLPIPLSSSQPLFLPGDSSVYSSADLVGHTTVRKSRVMQTTPLEIKKLVMYPN